MRYGVRLNASVLIFISVLFLLGFGGTLHAANLPTITRFQPITTVVNAPTAVAVDLSENLYVTESSNNRLIVFSPTGRYLKLIPGLDMPIGVAVSSDGRIFITNVGRGNVEVYNSHSALLYKLGKGDGEFTRPVAIAIDSSGNVYVVDSNEGRVKVYGSDGSFQFSFGAQGNGDSQFNYPTSISIDEQKGEIVVLDIPMLLSGEDVPQSPTIHVFDMNGDLLRSLGDNKLGDGELRRPLGVDVDSESRIYVADAYLNVIKVFDSDGMFLGEIKDQENPLKTPLGLAFSSKSDRLYVASVNSFDVEVYRVGNGTHEIVIRAGDGGSISPSEIVFVRNKQSQSFTITPKFQNEVADLKVDGFSMGPLTTFTFRDVIADHTIEATFVPKEVPESAIKLVVAEKESPSTLEDGEVKSDLYVAPSISPGPAKELSSEEGVEEGLIKDGKEDAFAKIYSSIIYLLKYLLIFGFLMAIGVVTVLKRKRKLDQLR